MSAVASTPLAGPELHQLKEWLGKRNTFSRVLETAILKQKVLLADEQIANGSVDRVAPGAAHAYQDVMKLTAALDVLEEFATGKRPMDVGQVVV